MTTKKGVVKSTSIKENEIDSAILSITQIENKN